jgi:hypothetical protein
LRNRTYQNHRNLSFAALAATAWLGKITPQIMGLTLRSGNFVDSVLWKELECQKALLDNPGLNMSFKGMGDGTGLGVSHETFMGGLDGEFSKLVALIGRTAARAYIELAERYLAERMAWET